MICCARNNDLTRTCDTTSRTIKLCALVSGIALIIACFNSFARNPTRYKDGEEMIIPVVFEKNGNSSDLWSYLLQNRIIYLAGHIDPGMADAIIGQLLYLESQDREKDICLYINSPGGNVLSGMGIINAMNYVKPDVATFCVAQASSMASVILSNGTPGKRFSFPIAEIMMHKISAGYYGKEPDVEIAAGRIIELNKLLVGMLAKNTGRTLDELMEVTDRDFFLNAQEAVDFGIIDAIIERSY